MSKRDAKLLIEDILESIDKITLYITNMTYEEFEADPKTIDAVIRNFAIIGEAAKSIPEKIKEKYSLIEWRKMAGLRNRVIHDYFGIDTSIIWQISQEYLHETKHKLEILLKEIH